MKNSVFSILIWVLSLSILSVGARNFEPGLSLDGPLYATIARNMVKTGELFYMDASIPDFKPFVEHPHLGFWVHALVFKIFGAADWSARIPGHLCYIAFLMMFFLWVRKFSGDWVATTSVLLLWIWPVFSNYFSNLYLDPGALVLGFSAIILIYESVQDSNLFYAFLAGIFLGLCAMYKGLTVLGFGFPCAYIVLTRAYRFQKIHLRPLIMAAVCLSSLTFVLSFYWALLKVSNVPDFLELYWTRQVANRFGRSLSLGAFFNGHFWWALCKDTYFLLPLVLLSFKNQKKGFALPWVMLFSFFLVYGPTERVGGQYWLMVMPWAAWLIASGLENVFSQIRPSHENLQVITGRAAIMLLCLIQYGPIATHTRFPPGQTPDILRIKSEKKIESLVLGVESDGDNFVNSAPFAWYGGVRVGYNLSTHPVPRADGQAMYLNYDKNLRSEISFKEKGWCVFRHYESTTLWTSCL